MEQDLTPRGSGSSSMVRAETRPLDDPQVVTVSSEEVPHLLDYLRVIYKHRWTVLSCLAIVFTTVAIATLKKVPIYAGKALIEINPQQPDVLNFREVLQFVSGDVESYRETQYRVLQSRTLAERVVRDLQLYRNPEFYRSRKLFGLIESDPEDIPSPSDPNPPDTSSEAFRNSVKNFQDLVDVSPIRRSNLIELSFYSRDPELAARITNQLAAEYIDQNLEVKWNETVKASEWLQGQLVDLKVKLEKAEDALQTYAQKHSIVFIAERQNLVNVRLDQLQQEYTKAQAERYKKEALYRLVQADRVQDLPGFLENKLIQDLTVRLAEVQREYAEMTALVKPEYPKAIQLKRQADSLREALEKEKLALATNVIDEYRSALQREKLLADAVEAQKREVNDIAEKTIQYNLLKREVDTSKQLYDGLLQRLKEAQVSAGLKASNVRIVDVAQVPKRPVKPRVLLNLALGFALGLSLGVGVAFFLEYLDKSLKTPDEVEYLLRLPSLGVLPAFFPDGSEKSAGKLAALGVAGGSEVAPAVQTHPQVMEAFRSLRTSILLSASPVPRLILVTSALPSEGKTTITINLGATLASLNSRVVIVDCDFRRPACHRLAGVKNIPGIVQCLTGHVALEEAIQPVPGVTNLFIVPCGPIPPNPAEILSSPVAAEYLQLLRSRFDYVLVDSPPLLSVADSRILARVTDAVILVARARRTPYEVVRRARGLLYGAGARILGVALNDVDFRRDGYGYGSYESGYGYNYGLGQHSDSVEAPGGGRSPAPESSNDS